MSMSVKKGREALVLLQNTVSLETPVDSEDSSRVGDFISDEILSPLELVESRLFVEKVIEILERDFSPREQMIIKKRFGLEDGEIHNLREIGDELKLTRERVRQIEQAVLKKLRERFARELAFI